MDARLWTAASCAGAAAHARRYEADVHTSGIFPVVRRAVEATIPDFSRSDRLLTVSTGPLLLLTPFVIFVCHNGYALYRPEMLACLGVLTAIGVVLGALMAAGGLLLQIPITAALVTLFVDVQTKWFNAWDWPMAGTFLAAALAAWVLRRHLSGLLTVVLAGMIVTSVFVGEPGRQQASATTAAQAGRRGLPPIVHIVLDEQIGIEGIPRRFDPDGRIAESLRTFYLDHGFQLFGKAFSRYSDTHTSLSHALNLVSTRRPFEFLQRPRRSATWVLDRSRYFETMARRGYVLRVYQSDFMDFCQVARVPIASCDTYALERLASIENAPLAPSQKMKLIAGMYSRLSFILARVHRGYRYTRATRWWAAWWPQWDLVGRVSSVSVPPVIERLGRDVAQAPDGTMFFAHLMLPHYPYAYDADCNLRPSVREWLRAYGARAPTVHYPGYLAQVTCVHKMLGAVFERMRAAGLYDDAIIVVHGDHGSRLGMPPQVASRKDYNPAAYIDAFSTLFAIKLPGRRARYDERLIGLDRLLQFFANWNRIPEGMAWVGPPVVNLAFRPPQLMPDFADGAPRQSPLHRRTAHGVSQP